MQLHMQPLITNIPRRNNNLRIMNTHNLKDIPNLKPLYRTQRAKQSFLLRCAPPKNRMRYWINRRAVVVMSPTGND